MRAIDMHVHVPRQPGLDEMGIEQSLRKFFRLKSAPETGDELAALYAEWDILGVIFSVDAETTTGEAPDTNDYVAEIVSSHPEQFIGFATVDPWKGEAAVEELERAVRDLGLISLEPVQVGDARVIPRDVFIEVVSPQLRNPEGDDLVALRVEIGGVKDGVEKTIRYELLDLYDADTGLTAMMRTTGFSLAITSVMQTDGRIGTTGVLTPDECVPAGAYLAELAARGVNVARSET